MPKDVALYNQHIGIEAGTELDAQASEEDGAPVVRKVWTLVFTDKTYGDRIKITINQETRDAVVRELTGGIVLAGGELPQKPE